MHIEVDISAAKAALEAAGKTLFGRQVLPVAARALEESWRDYYRGRGGVFWPRLGKGAEVADKATLEKFGETKWKRGAQGETVATVSVEGAWGAILRHKITGGTIRAENAENMAIPANPQARKNGASRNFASPKLRVVRFGKGGPLALVKDDRKPKGPGKKTRGKAGAAKKKPEVWYWLKESVTQKADPAALPPTGPLGAAVAAAVTKWLKKRLGGGG